MIHACSLSCARAWLALQADRAPDRGVHVLQLQGLARMTLRPLTDVLPCIGAITVTLMEAAYLDFSLHLLDSFDIMQVPGIKQGVAYAMERVRPFMGSMRSGCRDHSSQNVMSGPS